MTRRNYSHVSRSTLIPYPWKEKNQAFQCIWQIYEAVF